MGWQKAKELTFICSFYREGFYIFTFTILSLLLPLSFLLLARLSAARYYLQALNSASLPAWPYSLLYSLILIHPGVLYVVVYVVSTATLIHGLSGPSTQLSGPIVKPHLYSAWALLCAFHVCVGLGIEGSIAAGVVEANSSSGAPRSLLTRFIFLLGLHETMLQWSRLVVKPVVDDTIFGCVRNQKWIERVAVAVSFGVLWWWRLRHEVETLVVMAEAKADDRFMHISDFVGWWLYYITVTIGMVRIIKAIISWVETILLSARTATARYSIKEPRADDDKV